MHKIFYLYPPMTIWVGYRLSTAVQAGETWLIILQSFACLFIIVATILAYKGFYHRGKIDAYKDEIKRLENLKRQQGDNK